MRLARQHRQEEAVDLEALPQRRDHCPRCQGVRVFFRMPRTQFSLNAQWICFACRQPKETRS
jgi:hypothetical protein